MPLLTCRLCKSNLNTAPTFTIKNLPLGVQYFPDKEEFHDDKPVALDIYVCGHCGFAQSFGNQVVYVTEHSAATSISKSMTAHKQQQANEFVAKYALAGKKVIEAGCGDGHFLEMLLQAGVSQAVGVEPSAQSNQSGTAASTCKIYTDYISKGNVYSEAPFDAFATFHVMEHLPDIHDFIQGLRDNLVDGAVGLVEVPSSEQIENNGRFYDIINDHRNYFTLTTMKLAYEMNGFDVLDSYSNWGGEHNVTIVRKRPNNTAYDTQNAHIQKAKETFAEMNSNFNKIAIWGASMHALTLLTQVDYSKIQFVIDSATYKQNKYTPITHLPIVAPENAAFADVDFVLIVAPRFADEILEILKANNQFSGQIGLLEHNTITLINR
jgi:cyclopropane fatty-acyl-phospholipid synthase-like methyltransferase